jgi:hypothetical protein
LLDTALRLDVAVDAARRLAIADTVGVGFTLTAAVFAEAVSDALPVALASLACVLVGTTDTLVLVALDATGTTGAGPADWTATLPAVAADGLGHHLASRIPPTTMVTIDDTTIATTRGRRERVCVLLEASARAISCSAPTEGEGVAARSAVDDEAPEGDRAVAG